MIVRAPELLPEPELELVKRVPPGEPSDALEFEDAVIEAELPLRQRRLRIRGCALRAVVIEPDEHGSRHELRLVNAVLTGCDLSNVQAPEGTIDQVEIERSRLLGFSLTDGRAHHLSVRDCALQLASFAGAGLQSVRFEGVDLREASFQHARMRDVEFAGCRLEGADFRDARLTHCTIRGTSLEGVLGVPSLAGVRMPWGDLISSAGALADALGIDILDEDED